MLTLNELEALAELGSWEWPVDLADQLLEVLESDGATDARVLAAQCAAEVLNDELAVQLCDLISDAEAPTELRAACALALGPAIELSDLDGFEDEFDGPITQPVYEACLLALKTAHFDEQAPKLLRRRALEAASRAVGDWLHDAIAAAWRRDDPEWQVTAVFCMRHLREFEAEVRVALTHPNDMVRLEAVRACGYVPAAWDTLVKLVQSPKTAREVLFATIEPLCELRPDEAPEVLAKLAESDDEELAAAVDDALMMAHVLSDD